MRSISHDWKAIVCLFTVAIALLYYIEFKLLYLYDVLNDAKYSFSTFTTTNVVLLTFVGFLLYRKKDSKNKDLITALQLCLTIVILLIGFTLYLSLNNWSLVQID